MEQAQVKDWMHAVVHACGPDTPWSEVADAIARHDISAIVVVDPEGYAVGVVSRTDLLNATFIEPYMKAWRGLAARHIMSSPVVSVRADSAVEEAARIMRERRIHRVVVTEIDQGRERPVGILSLTDLVRHLPRAPHDGRPEDA